MMNFVYENQTFRFQMLFELYKRSNADIDYVMDFQQLAGDLGIGMKAFQACFKYLYMQDLIKMRQQNGGRDNGNNNYPASITHRGIRAVEEVFRDENRKTEFFPPYREMMM